MKDHPLIKEIWKIRHQIAEECDYDLHKIAELIRTREQTHPEKMTSKISKGFHLQLEVKHKHAYL